MPNPSVTWLSRLRNQQQWLLDALPSQCAVCGHWPGPRICHDCRTRWEGPQHRCYHCAMPLPALVSLCGQCLKKPPRLKHCTAVLDYGYPWQELITRFKFQADLGLVRSLAKIMAQHPKVQERLRTSDALLPMPASSERVRERGFDHCLLLAQSLSTQCHKPPLLITHVGQRQHLQHPQHTSGRDQRLRQLRGAFSLPPDQKTHIKNRNILLLDDVMTTGATLDALAQCLLTAGAASVSAIVLARSP